MQSRKRLASIEIDFGVTKFPLGNFRVEEGNPIIAGIHREMAQRGPHVGRLKILWCSLKCSRWKTAVSRAILAGEEVVDFSHAGGSYGSFNCGNPNLAGKLPKPLNNWGNPYTHLPFALRPHKLKLKYRILAGWVVLTKLQRISCYGIVP